MAKRISTAANVGSRRGDHRRQRCAVRKRRAGANLSGRLVAVSAVGGTAEVRNRPYWEKSYSGGPIDVKPLPPGLPGKDYKPVVVPNGGALPLRSSMASKSFI